MSEIQHKDLSSSATGIVLKKTKTSADNRRGIIQSIVILPQEDRFEINYTVERLDSNGVAFTDVMYKTKTAKFKDEARKGTVNYNATGDPDWSTFVETVPENLNVTNWNAQLGTAILGSAIAFVETLEQL